MVRNFVTGVVLGGVVAAGGLVVASQIAPIKAKPKADLAVAGQPQIAETQPTTIPEDAAAPAVQPSDAQPEIADPAALAKPPVETDEPLLKPLTNNDAPPPALVVPDLSLPSTPGRLPDIETAPPAAAESAAVAETVVPETQPAATAPAAEAPVATVDPAPEATAEVAPEPTEETPPATSSETALTPRLIVPDAERTENTVDGVTTGRLPAIETPVEGGAAPDLAEDAPALAPETAPAVDLPPLRRYAQAFDNPQAKPLFAVLLQDNGAPEVPREALAALPFPVTFVLDPLADGAAEAAAIYRKAGQEVVMLATGIPDGATPGDLEQSFAGMAATLGESVALMDTPKAAFQDDGKLSAEVVTLLADQGRGLVTFDRGLNAADQVARREGLPTVTIYRSLDDEGEEAPLIRRYLDRAAFKAAQEGQVVVIGSTRADTITALMEWTVEGRAASVVLAPISALMQDQ
ncbi:MAG: hypothetical protein RIT52_1276 [Pseudomonadota bacterium]